jgi:hypothetical protein
LWRGKRGWPTMPDGVNERVNIFVSVEDGFFNV